MHFRLRSHHIRFLLASLWLITLSKVIQAQQPDFSFSQLGSVQYKDKITKLEKLSIAKRYTDKSSQAWYDEIMTDRNKGLLHSFKEDELIYDTLLLNPCNSILKRIAAANTQYRFDTVSLYINRSMVANAACYGEGTIMINLGLFLWVDNEDELALVIAHELAHQLLGHLESNIEKNIAILTSDDFKDELRNIKKADYGKFDRFRKLMRGLSMETGKHSRYKETEADSLGLVLIRNANYNLKYAPRILLKLDKVDELFTSDKLYVLKGFFEKAPIDQSFFKIKPKYNGLSSAKVTMNADKDLDSIKTHPDCIKRYEALAGKGNIPVVKCCTVLDNALGRYKENAMLEIVRHLYENNSIGVCTHVCLFALYNQYAPAIYHNFLSLCFSKLYYQDKKLQRFNAVNAYAGRSTTIKELQDFLFEVSAADLENLAAYFMNAKTDSPSEDDAFAQLMFSTEVKMKDPVTAYAEFNKRFPKSKYQYIIQKK